MRCDDVFEILTSGPFPSGALTDDAVERHLYSCHECRKFAEALRPVQTGLDVGLPAYEGRLESVESGDKPVNLANRIQTLLLKEHENRQAEKRSRAISKRNFARFVIACAAVFVLGAAAAFAGPMLVRQVTTSQSLTASNRAPQTTPLAAGGVCNSEVLSHLKHGAVVPVSYRESKEACCLKCHGGNQLVRQKRQNTIGLVVMSCQKCHVEQSDWVKL